MLWPAQTALYYLHLQHSHVLEVARMPYILAKVFPTLKFLDWHYLHQQMCRRLGAPGEHLNILVATWMTWRPGGCLLLTHTKLKLEMGIS
jgi:hypothetical protein